MDPLKRNLQVAKMFALVASVVVLVSACAPQVQERQAQSGPPPAPPVIYVANAFDVFQAVFETISQAPGTAGWETERVVGGFLGVGGNTVTSTYANSGSWSIRQSDRAAGFIRAETVSDGVENTRNPVGTLVLSVPLPEVTHAVTVAVSGPDQAGPTQVVLTVSTRDALYMIDLVLNALDARFARTN
jgi:hypothetical protein